MKMKTLAVAVAALACGSQAFAAEVYNSMVHLYRLAVTFLLAWVSISKMK